MSKRIRKLAAGMLAASMAVSSAVCITEPLAVSAYELLGETSFDYKLIPWTPVESNSAKQEFEIQDGAAHMTIIVSDGTDHSQWDLQFRHRGLEFKAGHEYKVSFRAKSKREGMELCSYIGINNGAAQYFVLDGNTGDMHIGPDMDGKWPKPVTLTTEYQEFSGVFAPVFDVENTEWCFRYAKDLNDYGGNAEAGDEIWFDDMSIEDITDTETIPPVKTYGTTARRYSGLENNYISVNQLGYYPGLTKKATLGDDKGDILEGAKPLSLDGSYEFEIVNVSDDSVVYTGKTGEPVNDSDSGDTVCSIDFTELNEPGEYYIRIKDEEWRSFPFRIGNDIYSNKEHDLLTNVLNYFYQNRAGTEIDVRCITSGEINELAHRAQPDDRMGVILKDWCSERITDVETASDIGSSEINVGGGWYSPSEFGKYMTEGGISVWTLQNMYERAIQTEAGKEKFADGSGTVVIPENGNDYPDILDECRYELDFMSGMKVQTDEKTWGGYAGLYYHRALGVRFEPNPKNYEHDKHSVYAVEPPTYAATLDYAACAAQGARLWAPYDAEYAAELLKSAKEAYQAYKKYSGAENADAASFCAPDNKVINGMPDNDTDVSDEAYLAVCELYISAKVMEDKDAETYLKELSENANAFRITSSAGNGSGNTFDLTDTAAAGSMSLILHDDLLTEEQKGLLRTSLLEAADALLASEEKGYGIPYLHDEKGYGFGSNKSSVNNMIAMAYAYDTTGEAKYINGVVTGMDYLFGNNPLSYSYITGYGAYHTGNPSHGYWLKEIDETLPSAPDGVLVSGPNKGLQDKYIKAVGFGTGLPESPSQRCYADSVEAWSVNTSSLSGNASLAWIVSFIQDEAQTPPKAKAPVYGDANCDGIINVSDSVAVLQYVSNKTKYPLTEDGIINADIDGSEGLTGTDAIIIQKVDAGITDPEDLPLKK